MAEISNLNPQRESWVGVAGGKYHLINTIPRWREFLGQLMSKKYVACDTETSGLAHQTSHIVGMSFSWGAEYSYYIPIRHTKLVNIGGTNKKPEWEELSSDEKQLDVDVVLPSLREFFANTELVTIWHNFKFDAHFYLNENIKIKGIVHDTRLMHNLLDENSSAKLKDLAVLMIHKDANKWEKEVDEFRAKFARSHKIPKKDIHYGYLPLSLMVPYAASDTHYTWAIYKKYITQVGENKDLRGLYVNIEIPLMWVLLEMEHLGVTVDRNYFAKTSPDMGAEMDFLERELKKKLDNEEININSNQQLIQALQDKGVRFSKKTKSGSISIDREVLEGLSVKYSLCNDLLSYKDLKKKKSTYVDAILEKSKVDGCIHCEYNQNVATGRMCVVAGTLVQMPCDRSKYPNGVPIEKVKEGDWVYSYDTDGQLHLKQVKWVGVTGVREVVDLHWQGSGHKTEGHLLITKDHPAMTTDGQWVEVGLLKPKDRLMALSSGSKTEGYPYLYARYGKEIREHRFIYQSLNGSADVVHHLDGNKKNNSISNLAKTTIAEHSAHHMNCIPDDVKRSRADHLCTPQMRNKISKAVPRGKDHHSWKEISRITLLRWAAQCAGKISKIMKLSGMNYAVLKNKYKLAGIDLKLVSKRYGSDGLYVSPGRLSQALKLPQPECYKSLHLHFRKFKELCEFYGLTNNHEVLSVTPAGKATVYDLEVEDTHAFIANEICIHNSGKNPNLMNIPGRDEVIRAGFVPPIESLCSNCGWYSFASVPVDKCPSCGGTPEWDDDFFMLLIDYSQVEVRMTAHYSEDPILLKVYREAIEDVHTRTMCEIFDMGYAEAISILDNETHPQHKELKMQRKIAKMINFLIIYGGGAKSLSVKISTPDKQYTESLCFSFIQKYFAKYKGVKRWSNKVKIRARRDHFLQNHFGRYRRLPDLANAPAWSNQPSKKWMIERALRQGVNYLIQGTCADLFKISLIKVNNILKPTKSRVVMPIHDEIVMYLHRNDILLLPKIKAEMEDFDFKVPIVADICWTDTNWSAKKELKLQ